METIATHKTPSIDEPSHHISTHQLLSLLDSLDPAIQVITLACFNTLLWRKTVTSIDLFYELQHQPTFQSLEFTPLQRVNAEKNAREMMDILHNKKEVHLDDIYLSNFPTLTSTQLAALTEEELNTEIAACYAYPPMLDFIRKAHAKKYRIFIVSDTCYTKQQLQYILKIKLPADVFSMLNEIICSSDYGLSKLNGLFRNIFEYFHLSSKQILHIGSDPTTDYFAALMEKIHTKQFKPLDNVMENLQRMQVAAATFIDPTVRHLRPLVDPLRGVFATAPLDTSNPQSMIGFASLGPILYAFSRFICDEVETLMQAGKRPKVLFIMRDAHLASKACEALLGHPLGYRVHISRFAVIASSFRSKQDVDNYLMEMLKRKRFDHYVKQFLLPSELANSILEQIHDASDPDKIFTQLIHEQSTLTIIFQQSAQYRARLLRHLQNEAALTTGDTVLFVDIGYSGTAQRHLAPILKDEMGIETLGRYLIAVGTPQWRESKRGLLDPSWCDDRTLETLISYISLLEQLNTSNEPSTVGFDSNGNPLFDQALISEQQYAKLQSIQTECLRFIEEARHFFAKVCPPSIIDLRDHALAELVRLLFLPNQLELNYLQSFQFDLNLNTKDTFSIFDINKGLAGLRKRGLHFMEKNSRVHRTNYPAELRYAGLDLSFFLLSQKRFGLDINMQEINLRRENVPIIVMRGTDVIQTTLEATPTYENYYALWIPLGVTSPQIGVLFGKNYQWIQIESAEIIKKEAFLSDKESEHTYTAFSLLIFDHMTHHGNGLFECAPDSLAFIAPSNTLLQENDFIYRLVFRPLIGDSSNKFS